MNILFVSRELIAGDLAYRLKKEGCNVRLFIGDRSRKDCFENMLKKTSDWKKDLNWVGKNGLIVFDDVGYGKEQDRLRAMGYNVFGGNLRCDNLERDREFAQIVFSSCGVTPLKTYTFDKIKKAISFVRENQSAWVVKQNNHISTLNYVGVMEDGSDVLSLLKSYRKTLNGNVSVSLQKKVFGVEIGIARYFNGNDWMGPIEMNVEHKRLFHGGIGPMTGEMGTLMWYDTNEKNKLFQATLAKLKPFLQEANFKGDIDINCIVNKDEIYPLEVTSRLGCPSTQLQMEMNNSPWHEFLMAIAKGEKYNLKYKKGYGIVVSVAIPPFPYKGITKKYYSKGTMIFFKEKLSEKEMAQIHFEEVSVRKIDHEQKYCIAGSNGFILYITGHGETVQKAREDAYTLVDKIVIPKMFYRTDIGERFIDKDRELLEKWGWM